MSVARTFEIRTSKVTEEDVRELVANIRYFDELEVRSLRPNDSVYDVIMEGVEVSEYVESYHSVDARGDKTLLCIYGLNELGLGEEEFVMGIPWMLGTQELFKKEYSIDVLRRGRKLVESMSAYYPKLFNVVHCHNYKSHKFLEFCGFTIDKTPDEAHVYNGEQFYKFMLERK